MDNPEERDRFVNLGYQLDKLPSKVESFIKRLDKEMQRQISQAFDYITHSPFQHENPTIIKRLHGKKEGLLRYRLRDIRFTYRVDKNAKKIRILQIDNRGDIY